MAPYDGDSSSDEDLEYTETEVLLGYTDKEPAGEEVSRLGGRPVSPLGRSRETRLTRSRNGSQNPRRRVPPSPDAKCATTSWSSSCS